MRTKLHESFDRHPGRYDVVVDTEAPGRKDGTIKSVRVAVHNGIHADEVVRIAHTVIAADTSATVTIFSATRGEQAHFATINSKNIHDLLSEVSDGPTEEAEAPAPKAAKAEPAAKAQPDRRADGEPAPEAPAKPARRPRAAKLPGERFPVVRGKQLELGASAGTWPASAGTYLIRDYFQVEGRKATVAEVTAALGAQLKDVGVEFPAALISRLKQKGFLKECV